MPLKEMEEVNIMQKPMTEAQLERALAGTEGIYVLVAGREIPASELDD